MPEVVFTNVAFKDGDSDVYLKYGEAYSTAFAKIWGVPFMSTSSNYHDLPLWVAYLTPIVEQAGLTAEYVPSPALLPEARFYLLSCFTSNYIYAIRKAQSIRDRFPDAKIVLGGPHATCDPVRTVACGLFDYVVTGPGEAALLGILEGATQPGLVEGVRKAGGVYDSLPDYSLIDGNRGEFRQVSVITTVGCANACVYCTEGRSRVHIKPVPRVIEEIDGIFSEFPEVAFIRFNDSSFSQRVDLYWLASALGRMQVHSSCQLRADEMSDTVLHYLVTAGVRLVNIGCESGSDETLDRINKRMTVAQIEDACRRAKNFGLVVNTYWMMGLPGETARTAQQTIKTIERFFEQGMTDLAEVCICVPYPGTLLHTDPDRYDVEIQGELLYQNYMENDLSCMRTRDLDQRDIFTFWQIALNVIEERL